MIRPTTLKLHEFPDESFINVCYIPDQICDYLIKYFDDNPERHAQGAIWNQDHERVHNTNKKDSLDISFWVYKDDEDTRILSEYCLYLNLCISEYCFKYQRAKEMSLFGINEAVNIQKYEPAGGYKNFHCERGGLASQTRCLVFMTYLNDVEDGGTEFEYQNITVPAKKGLTTIWPPDWHHTHKGQISYTKEKYIVTGWLNYLE